MLGWLVIGICVVGIGLLSLGGGQNPFAGMSDDDIGWAIKSVILLVAVGSSAFFMRGVRIPQALRYIAIWTGLGALFVTSYSYRDDLQALRYRLMGDLMPPGQTQVVDASTASSGGITGDRAVRIRRRRDGHFGARTEVNGVTITMLVDTGASSVVLKPADARLVGIDVDRLNYSVPVQTANGTAYTAAVRIKKLSVGGIVVEGLEALVAKPGALGESLLGMTFLRRLRSYEFSGEFLTLRS